MIYIYALVCPISGEIRYIGKCKNQQRRLTRHLYDAVKHTNKRHVTRWIKKLLDHDLLPEMRIIRELEDGADWQSAEQEEIKAHRAAGFDLTNLTAGGDGFHDVHQDVLAKRGLLKKAFLAIPENYAKHLAMCREVHTKPEVKLKHSVATKALWEDPISRAAMIAAMNEPEAQQRRAAATKRRYDDPIYVYKHAKQIQERFSSPEGLAQIRSAGEKCRSDPDLEAKRLAAAKEAQSKPEYKAKQGADSKERWADPEFRARSPEWIEKGKQTRLANGGYGHSDETRAKQADSANARWADPIKGEAGRAANRTPEKRAKMSEKAYEVAKRPEVKAKRSAAMKASHARRKAAKLAAQLALLPEAAD